MIDKNNVLNDIHLTMGLSQLPVWTKEKDKNSRQKIKLTAEHFHIFFVIVLFFFDLFLFFFCFLSLNEGIATFTCCLCLGASGSVFPIKIQILHRGSIPPDISKDKSIKKQINE